VIGETISHYKIIEKLGQGGMGVVYKAQDTKLDRLVALKFLPHHLTGSDAEQARFIQEARAASALNHPNVCGIHAIGEHKGQVFIDMEFVEGKTLKRMIEDGELRIENCIQFAVQIGEALQEAHSRGIVHRDIKAENIMVNARNQIKVMDFGLAKLKGSLKLTRTSSTVGTLAYMAPEQIQGGEVDARSDIFSFGIVLYEMLTSQTPFQGEHEAAVMYSIVNAVPALPSSIRPSIPQEVDQIVQRLLEKDPEDRYQHADHVVSDLRRILKRTGRVSRSAMPAVPAPSGVQSDYATDSTVPPSSLPGRIPKRILVAGMAGLIMLVLVVGGYLLFLRPSRAIDSLAVLPFVNGSGDPNTEYLSDGITESLINSLTRIPQLRVVPRSTVFRLKGKDVDPQEAGASLKVKSVLAGRVVERDGALDVQIDLIDVENQSQIWGSHYRKNINDILALQEEIVGEVTSRLRITLANETKQQLARKSTENADAYQLYLQGRYYWNKRRTGEIEKAIDYFSRAIVLDPNYALAYVGLADSYIIQEQYSSVPGRESYPRAEAAARKALELDNSIAEAHASLGYIREYLWDWQGAEREYKAAIELNPKYATAYHWYSILLRCLGRGKESIAAIKRAQEVDPLSTVIAVNVAMGYRYEGEYPEATRRLRSIIETDSTFAVAYSQLGRVYRTQGELSSAIAPFRQAVKFSDRSAEYLSDLGNSLARLRQQQEANTVLTELLTRYEHHTASAYSVAKVYAGLGDTEKTFEWLEKDYSDHSGWFVWLPADDVWDGIRYDPRFIELLKKVGLPH
jgi:eukaryotic-like serine/threonine-protein kinase